MLLPAQLVDLGLALELDSEFWHYAWDAADRMRLFSNVAGKKLVLIYQPKLGKRVKHPEKLKKQNLSKARGLYKKFQGFNSDDVLTYAFDKNIDLQQLGRVNYITYRSDKWGRPKVDYKHDFKSKPLLYIDHELPHVIVVTSPKLKITTRGIEG